MLPGPPERRWGAVAGRAVFVALVTLAAVPAYLAVSPDWRGAVVRVASAIVVAVVLFGVRRHLAEAVRAHDRPPVEEALAAPVAPPLVDRRLVELAGQVTTACRSASYFHRAFWPRLASLTPRAPAPPPTRRLGRGPALDDLAAAVDALEKAR
jgi:hypothetical protein